MGRSPRTRYVIGIFPSWERLQSGLRALGELHDAVLELTLLADAQELADGDGQGELPLPLREDFAARVTLAFPANKGLVSCTAGELAQRLKRRLDEGSPSLTDALASWMREHHAQRLDADIGWGLIQLWVRVLSPDQELRVGETLLANGPLRIEVHDLVDR